MNKLSLNARSKQETKQKNSKFVAKFFFNLTTTQDFV